MSDSSRGTIVTSARQLVEVVMAPTFREEDLAQVMRPFRGRSKRTTAEQLAEATRILADAFPQVEIGRAGYVAVAAGSLIEQGADVYLIAAPILAHTEEALTGALLYLEACETLARDAELSPSREWDDLDTEEAITRFGPVVGERMSEQQGAWHAIKLLEVAALAVLSRLKEQRKRLRDDAAIAASVRRLEAARDLECLAKMLRVLDDEEIVVIHPDLQRGYLIRISGIGNNFQLHTLLADTLIGSPTEGWLPGQRPPAPVAAIARNAPFNPHNTPTTQGTFNLVNWYGLQPDHTLSNTPEGRKAWIRHEDAPADIAPFEGKRVILLGPVPYPRTWHTGRFFLDMHGEMEVMRQLTEHETRDWLSRLATAPHPQMPSAVSDATQAKWEGGTTKRGEGMSQDIPAQAVAAVERARQRYFALNNLAVLKDPHKHKRALVWAERVIALEPDSAQAWARKAHTLLYLGQFDDALDACDRAVALDALDAMAWETKCKALHELHRDEEVLSAAESYRVATRHRAVVTGDAKASEWQANYRYWFYTAAALKRLGRGAEARAAQRMLDGALQQR